MRSEAIIKSCPHGAQDSSEPHDGSRAKSFLPSVDLSSKIDVYCEAQLMTKQVAPKSASSSGGQQADEKKFARREKPVLQCKALLIAAGFKEEAVNAADSGDL